MTSRYCPTCRAEYIPQYPDNDEGNPPYSVMHLQTDPPQHVHPITRSPQEKAQ